MNVAERRKLTDVARGALPADLVIRGYEAIKLRNVQRFRDGVRALGF